jgi:hypothetical protein
MTGSRRAVEPGLEFGDALGRGRNGPLDGGILQVETPGHHRIAAPDHRPLHAGTSKTMLRAVAEAQGVSKDEIVRRLAI